MPKRPKRPCQVCNNPSVAKNLCEKHYRRLKKYGNTEIPKRPDDWGKRNKHPLYESWKQMFRTKAGREKVWDDFWVFVKDVGEERPSAKHTFRRYHFNEPWGPDNFYWNEEIPRSSDRAAYAREWRNKNKSKVKNTDLMQRYGITLETYSGMLEAQNGKCAICGKDESANRNLAVDHCHSIGTIRGLLCTHCNRGLGCFKDSVELLGYAIAYLKTTNTEGLAGNGRPLFLKETAWLLLRGRHC